jgi:hypothetical protein
MATVPQTTPWGDEMPVGVRFKAATGTSDVALQETLIRQVTDALPASPKVHPVDRASLQDAAIAALTELNPRDASEGMLAAQIVSAQFTAMDCLKRASEPTAALHVRDVHLRHAEKLMKVGLQLQEALDRRRGRGSANVTVGNLLTVQAGAQAVVGMQAEVAVGRVEAQAGLFDPTRGAHPGETGDASERSVPARSDERIRRSPGQVPRDERIRRSPVSPEERISRRV